MMPSKNNRWTLPSWLEPEYEISLEHRRIRWVRQRRCTIHRILDELAHGCVAIALRDSNAGDRPAGVLGLADAFGSTYRGQSQGLTAIQDSAKYISYIWL